MQRSSRQDERAFRTVVWAIIIPVLAILVLAATGCARYDGLTPKQTLFGMTETYISVGSVVATYVKLPDCKANPLARCSDADVVKELRRADDIFYTALHLAVDHIDDTTAELYRLAADKALAELRALLVRRAIAATLAKGTSP